VKFTKFYVGKTKLIATKNLCTQKIIIIGSAKQHKAQNFESFAPLRLQMALAQLCKTHQPICVDIQIPQLPHLPSQN
jgi:hypothetical protein